MSDASVFSQSRQVVFAKPVTREDLKRLLNTFLLTVGEPLSYNGIILGHIKVMAKLPAGEHYLFLSLTRLDRVDTKTSPAFMPTDDANVDSIDLTVNVMVFGFSRSAIETVVNAALQNTLAIV